MRIILPGLESVARVRHALQLYVNRIAEQIGARTALVAETHAKALLEVLVVDALTMGMTPSAQQAYNEGLMASYSRCLDPLFKLLGVRVDMEDVYTDFIDVLVVEQWGMLEPYLNERVPYNVSVEWLGTNLIVSSSVRGQHYPPRTRRPRRSARMLDRDFEQANQMIANMLQPKRRSGGISLEAYQRGEADALMDDYRHGLIDIETLRSLLSPSDSPSRRGLVSPPHETLRTSSKSPGGLPPCLIMKERERSLGLELWRMGANREYAEGEFDHIIEELLPPS